MICTSLCCILDLVTTVQNLITIAVLSILNLHLLQGFIQEKIQSINGPFTKICDLKMDLHKKSVTLKRTLKLKIIM